MQRLQKIKANTLFIRPISLMDAVEAGLRRILEIYRQRRRTHFLRQNSVELEVEILLLAVETPLCVNLLLLNNIICHGNLTATKYIFADLFDATGKKIELRIQRIFFLPRIDLCKERISVIRF